MHLEAKNHEHRFKLL